MKTINIYFAIIYIIALPIKKRKEILFHWKFSLVKQNFTNTVQFVQRLFSSFRAHNTDIKTSYLIINRTLNHSYDVHNFFTDTFGPIGPQIDIDNVPDRKK